MANNYDSKTEYFAAQEADKTAGELLNKAKMWNNNVEASGYREKLRDMYASYYGMYYTSDGHRISFGGEQGELANLPVNHFRNIGEHMLNMTTANRPSMEARATNTDYKSLVQTTLANGVLEYYMREKRLERYLKKATELAIVLGTGWIRLDWNASLGNIVDSVQDDNGQSIDIREGDLEFSNLSPFDVVFDSNHENEDLDWVLIRTWKNKFDISAKYPELADKIEGCQSKTQLEAYRISTNTYNDTSDEIPVFEFYHKRTESIPDGRYLLFLDQDIILQDIPMPYRTLPIFRISPSTILGTPFGYSPLFDIYPIQEAMNSLYSTILTNQNAFGVQNIWIKPGSNVNPSSVAGGLNVIESLEKPEPINLTNTPKEIFEFLQQLEKTAETISGVNSVARGNPESSLKTGAALALVQSMALQFMSGLQQSYVQLIEDTGTAIIKILQDYAEAPRLIAIAGKNNRTYMKEFAGKDIAQISRVVVDVGNPLARTTAGRVQMADQLLQYQLLKTPQQYVTLINTGNLDVITDDMQHEMFLIKAENEAMVDGKPVIAIVTDDHAQHLMDHKSVLADPELRMDTGLVQRVSQHMQQHIDLLRNTDPAFLQVMGQQPLPPAPGQQTGSQGTPPGAPDQNQGGPSPSQVNPDMQNMMQPPMQGQQGVGAPPGSNVVQGPGLPPQGEHLPHPPKPHGNLLPNKDMLPPQGVK